MIPSRRDWLDKLYYQVSYILSVLDSTCKPAITLTFITTALKVWTTSTESAVRGDFNTQQSIYRIIAALHELKLPSNFTVDTDVDQGRTMTYLRAG